MKRFLLTILMLFVFAGCASPVVFTVRNGVSKQPLAGVRVERYRHVNVFDKVTNPIGAFYHPLRVAEEKVTNQKGEATFTKLTRKGGFWIFPTNAQPLLIQVLGQEVHLGPETNKQPAAKWGYAVWPEKRILKHSAWPIQWPPE